MNLNQRIATPWYGAAIRFSVKIRKLSKINRIANPLSKKHSDYKSE